MWKGLTLVPHSIIRDPVNLTFHNFRIRQLSTLQSVAVDRYDKWLIESWLYCYSTSSFIDFTILVWVWKQISDKSLSIKRNYQAPPFTANCVFVQKHAFKSLINTGNRPHSLLLRLSSLIANLECSALRLINGSWLAGGHFEHFISFSHHRRFATQNSHRFKIFLQKNGALTKNTLVTLRSRESLCVCTWSNNGSI